MRVSRSLAACEGAVLVVDASQGIEARRHWQTRTLRSSMTSKLFPVINKIDLPSARPDVVKEEIEDVIGIDASEGASRFSEKQH